MLTTDTLHDTIVVCDTEGGTWWPDEDAESEINAAANPEAKAIEICDQEPDRGTWMQ
jgi:hypothetical protein